MANRKKSKTDQGAIEEKAPPLMAEDADETSQMIEEAAYYIGLNRQLNSQAGDSLSDWFEAEKAVKKDLEEE